MISVKTRLIIFVIIITLIGCHHKKSGNESNKAISISISSERSVKSNQPLNQRINVLESVSPESEINYLWTLISKPEGSNVVVSGDNSDNFTFQSDAPGLYLYQVDVTDNLGNLVSENIEINVSEDNTIPSIRAFYVEQEQSTLGDSQVFIIDTSDADGDKLTCRLDYTGIGLDIVTIDDCGSEEVSVELEYGGHFRPILTVTDNNHTKQRSSLFAVRGSIYGTGSPRHASDFSDSFPVEYYLRDKNEFFIESVELISDDKQSILLLDRDSETNFIGLVEAADLKPGLNRLAFKIKNVYDELYYEVFDIELDQYPSIRISGEKWKLGQTELIEEGSYELEIECIDDFHSLETPNCNLIVEQNGVEITADTVNGLKHKYLLDLIKSNKNLSEIRITAIDSADKTSTNSLRLLTPEDNLKLTSSIANGEIIEFNEKFILSKTPNAYQLYDFNTSDLIEILPFDFSGPSNEPKTSLTMNGLIYGRNFVLGKTTVLSGFLGYWTPESNSVLVETDSDIGEGGANFHFSIGNTTAVWSGYGSGVFIFDSEETVSEDEIFEGMVSLNDISALISYEPDFGMVYENTDSELIWLDKASESQRILGNKGDTTIHEHSKDKVLYSKEIDNRFYYHLTSGEDLITLTSEAIRANPPGGKIAGEWVAYHENPGSSEWNILTKQGTQMSVTRIEGPNENFITELAENGSFIYEDGISYFWVTEADEISEIGSKELIGNFTFISGSWYTNIDRFIFEIVN